jgi:putative transposase
MSQSLSQIYLHLIFSTKDRLPFLKTKQLRTEMFSYLAGTCRNLDSPALQVGGMPDHVHILCRLAKTITIADLVRELKRESSKWAKDHIPDFAWQKGYGAFSLSPAHVKPADKYILGQEAHHRTVTFQDELRKLCRKYGLELDERYVWK